MIGLDSFTVVSVLKRTCLFGSIFTRSTNKHAVSTKLNFSFNSIYIINVNKFCTLFNTKTWSLAAFLNKYHKSQRKSRFALFSPHYFIAVPHWSHVLNMTFKIEKLLQYFSSKHLVSTIILTLCIIPQLLHPPVLTSLCQ